MKKNLPKYYLVCCFVLIAFCCAESARAQLSFTQRNDLLGPGDYHSGISVGIADMNGDGLDDIVRLSEGRILIIEYQQPNGGVFQTMEVGQMSTQSAWTLCIADVDNNGFNDVMNGGSYDGMKIVMANNDGTAFTTTELPGPTLFAQGSNFADINNDGWIDAFVCHDDAESRIWGNDGAGNLLMNDEWIDMTTTPASDNSGNYGSVWTDFDNDGDLDLYIAKCRQAVNDPTDPRRINALFVNDGNGNYQERAEEFGLKIGFQTWTAEFQDIDNDGDMDAFLTNHDTNNQLLENDGTGHFTDISAAAGIGVTANPLEGVMRDFDNDGFVDIIIAGDVFHYYKNNGDKTFTEITTDLFGPKEMHSYGIGDLNHDGFLDVYATYANGYTTPSNDDDLLFLNNTNSNNFLAVNLTGDITNKNGVGARIEIYGDWGIQVREVRAGESYGIHNTFTQHFGLGASTEVDSMIIRWPSSKVDLIEDVGINQFVDVLEGGCISPNAGLTLTGATKFCTGDSLIISAGPNLSYLWSTGQTTQEIVVYNSGNYSVTVSDAAGCEGFSINIPVTVDPDDTPSIYTNKDTINCPGTPVVLTSSLAPSYQWSNGEISRSITVTEPDAYIVTVPGLCQEFSSPPFNLEVFDPQAPSTLNDTIQGPGSGVLTAVGEKLVWYDSQFDGEEVATGPEFITPELTETTTYWVEDNIDFSPGRLFGGKKDSTGVGSFDDNGFAGLSIQTFEKTRIVSVKVYAESAGERSIRFYDNGNGNNLGMKVFMIPEGESRLDIDLELPKSSEIFMFINNNANLYHDDASVVNFPYPLGEYAEISSSADGNYYYFYDFEVELVFPTICTSERSPAVLVVEPGVGTQDINTSTQVNLFPNPASDLLQMQLNLSADTQVQIFDLQGKTLYQQRMAPKTNENIDVADWARGIYFVKVSSGQEVYFGKVILQ